MLQKTFLHSNWEFAEKSWPGGKVATVQTGWLPAEVPGHVHLDLVANGIIAHPFERMNELGCQWVDKADWSYQTTFYWSPKEDCPKRVLSFEGLDTICSVHLNDELLAEHDSMFVPLEVDVTDKLREGSNELRIDFKSAVRVGEERREAYFAANNIPPDTLWFEERAFVRKAQYMFGWDWGPRLVSCGIWRPVCLLEYSARILDVHTTSWLEDEDKGVVDIKTSIEGAGEAVHLLFRRLPGGGFDGPQVLVEGENEIEDPAIWLDPYDGAADSYQLVTVLHRLDGKRPAIAQLLEEKPALGLLLALEPEGEHDRNIQNFGFCQTRLLRETDQWGESFEFEVNGVKTWARGANWIPDHSFPSVIDKARLRDRLEKAKDMNFNMLRIWGGGLYETDEFYDLCDELGILVWQDFPFACSYYPDDEHWQEVVRKEAEVNIKRLRNHPCLALWCGNNENLEMHRNKWGGQKQPPRYFGENQYDKVLPEAVEAFDSGRSYIATSPLGEAPPEAPVTNDKRRGPNSDHYGDQHNWDVWHGRGDWRFYSDSEGRFSSEYGFASSCSTSVWAKTLAEEDWNPHSPVVQWHDRTGKGHDTFHGFVKLHYPEPVTLEDWVYYSQLNQRDALRHGVEHYRRSAFCRGSLIWQLNDCWPVQSWAIMDSDGIYKALGYELRRLYDDVMLSIERHNENVKVWLVNHGIEAFSSTVDLTAVDLRTGEVLREWQSAELTAEPDSIHQALEVDISGLAVPDTILFASCGEDFKQTWRLLGEPKSSHFAPPTTLVISTHEEGLLRIKLDAPVVDLMLTAEGDPSPFLDNFITSPAGIVEIECASIPESIEARSLAGEHRVATTRGPL